MAAPFLTQLLHSDALSGRPSALERLSRERPELVAEAERVFGDAVKAHRWLTKPRTIFEGVAPAQLALSPDGERVVREALVRIEHGIFS